MSSPATGRQKLMLFLLALCIVQFSGAWIYPGYTFGTAILSGKTFGVPFQYGLWAFILIVTAQLIRRRGVAPFGQVLGPFLPFMLVGFVAAAFGIDPIGGFKAVMLWGLMAVSAVVIAEGLPTERLQHGLLSILAVILFLSIALSVVVPSYGVMGGEGGHMWRGLFVGKNLFGWISALALVVAAAAYRRGYRRLPALVVVLAVISLIGSDSKGALVAAVVALAYGYCVPWLMRRVTPGFGIALIIGGLFCAIILAALMLPTVLEALGRDITLTGRTSIWKMYFNSMSQTPWLGEGPGSYTAPSAITTILADRLSNFGVINSPHNIYLGMLGDAGLFGLMVFLGLMVYMALVAPAWHPGRLWMLSGTIAFLILAGGLVETHEVFSASTGWFLLILARAMALQADSTVRPAVQRPAGAGRTDAGRWAQAARLRAEH